MLDVHRVHVYIMTFCRLATASVYSKRDELVLSTHWSTWLTETRLCCHIAIWNPTWNRESSQISHHVMTAVYVDFTQLVLCFWWSSRIINKTAPAQLRRNLRSFALSWCRQAATLCVFMCVWIGLFLVSKVRQEHHRWLPPLFHSHSQQTGLEWAVPGPGGDLLYILPRPSSPHLQRVFPRWEELDPGMLQLMLPPHMTPGVDPKKAYWMGHPHCWRVRGTSRIAG